MGFLPQDLERSVKRIVRRALHEGDAGEPRSGLSRGIRKIAQSETEGSRNVDHETLIQLVTQRICDFCLAEYGGETRANVDLMQTLRGFCTDG